jgi:hypothetical protein
MRKETLKLAGVPVVADQRFVKVLHLNLERRFFDAIAAGTKPFEYRKATPYWKKRIVGKDFDEIHLMLGYPSRDDESRILRRRWAGYTVEKIKHQIFGPRRVNVLAIDVSKHLNDKLRHGGE